MPTPTVKSRRLSNARIESILGRLNGEDALKRRQAADELMTLPSEQICEVVEYNKGIIDPGEAIIKLIAGPLLWLLIVFTLSMRALPLAGGLVFAFCLLFGFYTLRLLLHTGERHRTRCRALTRVIEPILGHLDGVSAVPLMADALFDKGESARALARAVLIQQLPRLEAGHAALLAPSQQRRLNDVLRVSDIELMDVELMVAILRAYAQVGDASTLEPVGHLARSAVNFRVRDTANECLPPLQARIAAAEEREQQAQVGRTLLRPSAPAQTEPNTLLRAAAPSQEAAPEQLLRPQSEASGR